MSEVRRLWIPGPAGRLEAALRVAATPRALGVVAHPHPLHGGTLDNAVVFHAEREMHRLGLTTLRFNFRGVGASEGAHDEGRGEVDDVAAAVTWLRGLGDDKPIVLGGYSFGAWCVLRHAARDPSVGGVASIGLPAGIYDVAAPVAALRRPLAVVQASDDEVGSLDAVRAALEAARPEADLRIVAGTTHLFPGRARDAGAAFASAVERMLRGQVSNPPVARSPSDGT
jgi:alpha/beta superfamily hydrolase